MKMRLPVSILTGYLGSGKTTLLNKLLQSAEMRMSAIIVNEFGAIGLDHLLVEKGNEETILLSNGCLCCAVLGDLVQSLRGLLERREEGKVIPFERIIIETTGLADPAPLIHMMMNDPVLCEGLRLDGIIATIDAVHGMNQLDQYVESLKQAAMADRLVLTKTSLASSEKVDLLRAKLATINVSAPILLSENLTPGDILNAGLYDPQIKDLNVRRWLKEEAYQEIRNGQKSTHGRHDHRIENFHICFDVPLDWEKFINWAEMITTLYGNNLLRLKGIVNVKGEERPLVLHAVQHLFHAPVQLPAWPDSRKDSRLIFITRDLPEKIIKDSLAAFDLT